MPTRGEDVACGEDALADKEGDDARVGEGDGGVGGGGAREEGGAGGAELAHEAGVEDAVADALVEEEHERVARVVAVDDGRARAVHAHEHVAPQRAQQRVPRPRVLGVQARNDLPVHLKRRPHKSRHFSHNFLSFH